MPHRALQKWTLGLWSAGVPLLAAVVLDGIGVIRIVRHARGLAG